MTAGQLRKDAITPRGGARRGAGRKTDEERSTVVYADYNAARAKREMHNAKIAEYEERKLAGELVERAVVTRTMQQIVAAARARLLSLPAKIAPMLVGVESIAEIEDMLRSELREAMQELAGDAGRR